MPGVPSDSAAWRPSPARIRPLMLLALLAMLGVPAAGTAVRGESAVPSPEQFFGFPMGATRRIAGWSRIVEYFRAVDRLSDRVVVQDLGPTTEGRPYLLAIVSAPDTIADLPGYQAMQRQLADPRVTSAADADRIAREGKAVVLIGGNIHGNEIGSSQMVNDLLYSLATSDAAQVKRVLEEQLNRS